MKAEALALLIEYLVDEFFYFNPKQKELFRTIVGLVLTDPNFRHNREFYSLTNSDSSVDKAVTKFIVNLHLYNFTVWDETFEQLCVSETATKKAVVEFYWDTNNLEHEYFSKKYPEFPHFLWNATSQYWQVFYPLAQKRS